MYAIIFLMSMMSFSITTGAMDKPKPTYSGFGTPAKGNSPTNASVHLRTSKEQSEGAAPASAIKLDDLADLEAGNYQENDALLAARQSSPTMINSQLVASIKQELGGTCGDNYLTAQLAQLRQMNAQAYNAIESHYAQANQATRAKKTQTLSNDLLLQLHKMVAGAAQIETNEHKKKAAEQEQLAASHAKRADRNGYIGIFFTTLMGAIGFYMNHQCPK